MFLSTQSYNLNLDAVGGTVPISAVATVRHGANASKAPIHNDGAGDISDTPSQFLILRNLPLHVSEIDLAKAFSTLEKFQFPKRYRRILLARERASGISSGFAFIEFASAADCKAAFQHLSRAFSKDNNSVTLFDKQVQFNFIHPGVFVPIYAASNQQNQASAEKFSFLAANGSTRMSYWDENVYVGVYVSPESQSDDVSAFLTNLGSEILPPTSVDPSTTISENAKQIKKKRSEAVVSAKKMTPRLLQVWQSKQQELHGSNTTTNRESEHNTAWQESFADPSRPVCLLCRRKFTAFDQVNKHERLSLLHSHMLTMTEKCEIARRKLEKAKESMGNPTTSSAYRDRARERRVAQNQPASATSTKQADNQVTLPTDTAPPTATTTTTTTTTTTATANAVEVEGDDDDDDMFAVSKGSKMLSSMGWKSGSALGATGSGISQAIKPEMYAQGVGLGAENAKLDIEKEARPGGSGESFAEKVREVARERFEKAQ